MVIKETLNINTFKNLVAVTVFIFAVFVGFFIIPEQTNAQSCAAGACSRPGATCQGCGRPAGNDDCAGPGCSTPVSQPRPVYYSQPQRSSPSFINDLLDLSLGFTSVKYDNDTNIKTDSHNKTTYTVTNTDNSNRSVRTNYSYLDNSYVNNAVNVDDHSVYSYVSTNKKLAYHDDDDDDDNNDDDLDVVCRVSDTFIEEGDTVRFEADVDGGDSPFDYDWRGDIDGDDRTETVRFNREGRYQVSVRVEDDNGDVATDDCPDIIVDDGGNNIIINNTPNPPSGNLASLNSVFLSQVPYTGPKETLTVIGYIVAMFVWSVTIVFFIAKRKGKSLVSDRISQFKNKNKVAVKVG